ncbi:MAG: acetylornithine/succinylornithine family transaminase [Anaerovoracaceae bacterium]|jgi:acetylornithine/N-succinyldiaminopimelate aminotransferase
MKTSEELKAIDQACIVHTYARYDIALESGRGARCRDFDGREYIDFTSGIGVNSLGFADPEWAAAVAEQAGKLQHISNLFYTGPMIRLAGVLTERSGMKKVFFANSGAEANECAIKAARKYGNRRSDNKKNRIITLQNAFHGRTMATITATGQEKYHQDFFPFVSGFDYCEANNIEMLRGLVGDDTCAIMIELVQGEGGLCVIDRAFAREAAELCRQHDMLLIIDEVQTGIGRTGTFFACEQYDLEPDIITFAKGIGGGLPLGGALFNERTQDILEPGDHGTTYGGNPVATAAAGVVMRRMDDAFLVDVRAKGARIVSALREIPQVRDISGLGMMLGFRVDGCEAAEAVKAGQENGVLMLTAKDKVRLLPPLSISGEELEEGLTRLRRAVEAAAKG